MGDSSVVEALVEALNDDNASVPSRRHRSPRQDRGSRRRGALDRSSPESPAVDIRKAAADALGQIGDLAALDALTAALRTRAGASASLPPTRSAALATAAQRRLSRPRSRTGTTTCGVPRRRPSRRSAGSRKFPSRGSRTACHRYLSASHERLPARHLADRGYSHAGGTCPTACPEHFREAQASPPIAEKVTG